jgi:hypothetical protein
MSANRTDSNDRRDLDNIAWRVFREADLGYTETILVSEGYEVHERVLDAVAHIGYGDLTLTRIARGCRVVLLPHFQQWMGRANSVLDNQRRLAVYALVSELQRLLGYMPQFRRPVGDYVFLGSYRGDLNEIGLTVELWGRADGEFVMVRSDGDSRCYEKSRTPDHFQAREAFRRLGKEVGAAAV